MTHHDLRQKNIVPTSVRRDQALAAMLMVAHREHLLTLARQELAALTADRTMHRELYRRALVGLEPAEALSPVLREDLVRELHTQGMTDLAIASFTRQTLYTAARIRARLGLAPNERPAARILSFPTAGHHTADQLPTSANRSA